MKPLRSLLFVPGHRDRMLQRALATDAADALLPDLEDAVPEEDKDAARSLVADAIAGSGDRPFFVRVNGVESGRTQDDLEAVVPARPVGVFLPKTDSADAVREVAGWLDVLDPLTADRPPLVLVPMLESALGVLRTYEIASSSPRVWSVCFGSARDGDFQTDLGSDWSPEGIELLYARSKVVLDARAAGIEYPLDGVYADIADPEGLAADSARSKSLGFRGRPAIHPNQLEAINTAYTPSHAEVAYYRGVLEAFEAALARGDAATTFQGRLVDYAMAGRARRVLQLAGSLDSTAG